VLPTYEIGMKLNWE